MFINPRPPVGARRLYTAVVAPPPSKKSWIRACPKPLHSSHLLTWHRQFGHQEHRLYIVLTREVNGHRPTLSVRYIRATCDNEMGGDVVRKQRYTVSIKTVAPNIGASIDLGPSWGWFPRPSLYPSPKRSE